MSSLLIGIVNYPIICVLRSLCVSNERKINLSVSNRILLLSISHIDYLAFRKSISFVINMFGNIVPVAAVGPAQVLPGTILQTSTNVVPNTAMGNNDLVIIQDATNATSQAELINQLQNHITENQQILIITDDQGQDQCNFT